MKKWQVASAIAAAVVITPMTADAYTSLPNKEGVQTIDVAESGDVRIITFSEAVKADSIVDNKNIRLKDLTDGIPVTIATKTEGKEVKLSLVDAHYKENHQYELLIDNSITNTDGLPLSTSIRYVYETVNTGEETETDSPPIEQEKPSEPEVQPNIPEEKPEEVTPIETEPTPETPEVKPVEPEPKPEVPEEVTPTEPEPIPETPEVKPVEPEPKPEVPEEVTPTEPENPLSYKNDADVLRRYDMGNDITYHVMKHEGAANYEVQITIGDELVGGYYGVDKKELYGYTIGETNPTTRTHAQFKLTPLIDKLNGNKLLGFTYESKNYKNKTKLREAMQLNASTNLLEVSKVYADLATEFRAEYGKSPLTVHEAATQAAKNHSIDMANKNYFSHISLTGTEPSDRINAIQYVGNFVGENISAGDPTIFDTHVGWINSQGHRDNLLKDAYTHIGYGVHYNQTSKYGYYSTTKFIKLDESIINGPQIEPNDPSVQLENPLSYKNEADVLRRYDMGNDITYHVMKHEGAANYEVQITIDDELVGGYFGVEGKELFGYTIGEQRSTLANEMFVVRTSNQFKLTELTDTLDGNKLRGIVYELKNYENPTKLREAMQLHASQNLLEVSKVYADLATEFRSEHGKAPLVVDEAATEAAKNHSIDMANKQTLIPYVNENVSAGRSSIFEAHAGSVIYDWHRNNLLNEQYTHIGYGVAYNQESIYGLYHTTKFVK